MLQNPVWPALQMITMRKNSFTINLDINCEKNKMAFLKVI